MKRFLIFLVFASAAAIVVWAFLPPSCSEVTDLTRQEGREGNYEVKIERVVKTCGFLSKTGGADYVFYTRTVSSEWNEELTLPQDELLPIPADAIKIVSDKIAYAFLFNTLITTSDAGQTWSTWVLSAQKLETETMYEKDIAWTGIKTVSINEDGTGDIAIYGKGKSSNEVTVMMRTRDFGSSWQPFRSATTRPVVLSDTGEVCRIPDK